MLAVEAVKGGPVLAEHRNVSGIGRNRNGVLTSCYPKQANKWSDSLDA